MESFFFFINGILYISAIDSSFTSKLHLFTQTPVLTLISSVHSLSCVWLFSTPWTVAHQASLSITNSWSLLKFTTWCHPTISSSAVPFSSCSQSFPASGSFPMSQLSTSGGQIIGISASASVLPMNTQDRSPLGWTGWISLKSKGLLLQHHSSKASILRRSAFFMVQLSHPYMTAGKTTGLTSGTFVGEVMSLLFNMLSRLVTGFLPRSKNLLISWLKSSSAVILEPPKNMCIKWFSTSVTPFSPIITHKFMIMVTVLIPKQFHLMVIIPSSDFFGHLLLIWLICYRFIGFLPAIFFISFYIVTEVSYATGYLAQTPGHGIKTHKIVNTWWER